MIKNKKGPGLRSGSCVVSNWSGLSDFVDDNEFVGTRDGCGEHGVLPFFSPDFNFMGGFGWGKVYVVIYNNLSFFCAGILCFTHYNLPTNLLAKSNLVFGVWLSGDPVGAGHQFSCDHDTIAPVGGDDDDLPATQER